MLFTGKTDPNILRRLFLKYNKNPPSVLEHQQGIKTKICYTKVFACKYSIAYLLENVNNSSKIDVFSRFLLIFRKNRG